MTWGEMSAFLDTLCDKAGSPYFNDIEKSMFLNLAMTDLVETEYTMFEKDGEHKIRLLDIQRPFSKANSAFLILSGGAPNDLLDFRYLLRLSGTFNAIDCNGQAITITKPIRPGRKDSIDVAKDDPFNKPIDADPIYTYDNTGAQKRITVHSTTTPILLEGDFLKNFIQINVSIPATVFEFEKKIGEEVCLLASKKMLGNIENFNMAQAIIPEIQQINGSFQ